MEIRKFFLLLLITILVQGEDRFHPKPSHLKPQLEFKNVDPLFKNVEGHDSFWLSEAAKYLESKLKSTKNTKKAKNVILFVGDGLSIATVAATRMYLGGEELSLSFEKFPHYGLAKTYCVDRQVSDSACTASALMSGIKASYRGIGLTANVSNIQCNFSEEDVTYSIIKSAQDAGKATGIVTNMRLTHATPAAAYAHSPHRDWENNELIPSTCKNSATSKIVDIAHQLVYNEEAKKIKVLLGAGTRHFLNTTIKNDEGRNGERTDGKNLIDEWLQDRNKRGNAQYIWHKAQLDVIDYDKTDFLLGLFEHDHCMYRLDVLNNKLENQEPMLTQMTETAIKMLQKDDNGFFLFVEGGKIDHAHHSNYARKSVDETAEFSRAIDLARRMTNEDDTLIVVTSDHSHVFTYSGEPKRHNDILKTTGDIADDGLPYETLSYGNGPGNSRTWKEDGSRADVTNDDFTSLSRRYSSMVPLSSETHSGEDVAVYASGPFSFLFTGSYEQSDIPMAMAYAAKIGQYFEEDLETTTKCEGDDCGDSAHGLYVMTALLLLNLVVLYFL